MLGMNFKIDPIDPKDLENAKAKLEKVGTLCAQEVNIHKHTRTLGELCRTAFYPLDKKYQLSPITDFGPAPTGAVEKKAHLKKVSEKENLDFETTVKEILDYAAKDEKIKHIKTVLNSVKTLGKSADRETGLIAREILVKTWDLAKSTTTYANAKDVLIFVLKHNIATGGGCIPGISARLTLPYSHFVTAQLEDKHSKAFQSQYSPASAAAGPVNYSDDDELALAIHESLRFSEPPKPAAAAAKSSAVAKDDFVEDEIELAKALSLSMTK